MPLGLFKGSSYLPSDRGLFGDLPFELGDCVGGDALIIGNVWVTVTTMLRNSGAAESLHVLSDATRLAIVESLIIEPAPVGEIADRFPISRPAMSRHLRLLREAGLVEVESAGTRHIYRVRPQGVEALREYMDELWRAAAARYVITTENLKDSS